MNCVLRKWRMSDAKDLAAAYHRRGIGKKLFEAMRRDYAHQVFDSRTALLHGNIMQSGTEAALSLPVWRTSLTWISR